MKAKWKFHRVTGEPVILPLVTSRIRAGFPHADDYLETPFNLTDFLFQNKPATFFVEVAGDSMKDVGIAPGDKLVVDRDAEARDGSIVVAVVNGQFALMRLRRRNGTVILVAENPDYPPITFAEGDERSIWGVVRHVIKNY